MKRRPILARPLALAFGLTLVVSAGACTKTDKPASNKDADAPADKAEAGKSAGDAAEAAEPGEDLPAGEDLLAAHVEAAGGAETIAKFETLHAKGTVDTGKQKLEGTTELWWKKGGKFYLEQEIEGVGKSRAGYDGETVWTDDPITGLRKLEGKEAASYIQSAMMFPAHDWRDHFEAAKTLGKKQLDGDEVWEVELQSAEGPAVVVGLDADDKLIRYMKSKQVTSLGEMPFEAFTQDYREVEGYKFAMKKKSAVTGLLELEEEITEFEVNVELDDAMFAFPSKSEVVPLDPSKQAPVESPEHEDAGQGDGDGDK